MENDIGFRCTPTNNSILSLSFENVECFDLSRYLTMGSLKSNAEDFRCSNRKVDGYNHYELQLLYENDQEAFFKKIEQPEALHYLTMDVFTLEELFNKT
jgi:hypothetical protein